MLFYGLFQSLFCPPHSCIICIDVQHFSYPIQDLIKSNCLVFASLCDAVGKPSAFGEMAPPIQSRDDREFACVEQLAKSTVGIK